MNKWFSPKTANKGKEIQFSPFLFRIELEVVAAKGEKNEQTFGLKWG